MDIMTIFKNNKAFSLVELIVAMILASIVMLSVYVMLIIAYGQFNDLSEESERFNNLQVFERMFQRSAMTCSYYKIQDKTFYFYNMNGTYEKYIFENISTDDFDNITSKSYDEKSKKYLDTIENNNKSYKLIYLKKSGSNISYTKGGTQGYIKTSSVTYTADTTEEEKVLFDNIVKVYYETSQEIKTDNFKNFTGKDVFSIWAKNGDLISSKIYTPFIKLIIIYKDNKGRLRRAYIACRLRGIEGTEFKN